MLAVLALVALRLALGCHFLYEGVWKIKHHDEFSAEPFLTQAKGPLAGFFYAMVPDIDARQRLHVVVDAKGNKSIDSKGIADRWQCIRDEYSQFYSPVSEKGEDAEDAKDTREDLKKNAKRICEKFQKNLDEYLKENLDDIDAYFGSLDRFEKDKERDQNAPFQKQRRWERMMLLRAEADKWIKDIEDQEQAYKNELYSLLTEAQKERGLPRGSWNLLKWERMEQINFAVTYGLTAIGLCLMLGLGTTPAALGGAAFMCFVVMTQPAFPGIYPPDSPIVGHALLVNKDFVEMLALLVVAATPVGRWGGLDFYLYRWFVDPICARFTRKKQ